MSDCLLGVELGLMGIGYGLPLCVPPQHVSLHPLGIVPKVAFALGRALLCMIKIWMRSWVCII